MGDGDDVLAGARRFGAGGAVALALALAATRGCPTVVERLVDPI